MITHLLDGVGKLFEGWISEYPIICFISIIKKTSSSPPVVKVFSKSTIKN